MEKEKKLKEPEENPSVNPEGTEREGIGEPAEQESSVEDSSGSSVIGSPAVEEREEESVESGKKNEEKSGDGPVDGRVSKLGDCFGDYEGTMRLLAELPGQEWHEGFRTFMSAVEGYACGKGIGSPTVDRMLQLLFSIGEGCHSGALTLSMAETLMKGIEHDRLLAEREREAEIKGRNATITEHLRRPTPGDGVPGLGGNISMRRRSDRGIFSLAEDAR